MAVTVEFVQAGGYSAAQYRQAFNALLTKGTSPTLARSGILPFNSFELNASAQGTPDMTLNVADGVVIIPAASGGNYIFVNDASKVVTHTAANATNPRIDLIVAQVYDNAAGDAQATSNQTQPGSTAGTAPVQNLTGDIVIVQGTPGAVPAVPALPNSRCVILKQVTVRAATTSILNSDLANTGRAPFTVAAGGILPVRDGTDQATLAGYDGLWIDRIDVNQLLRHDGSAFIVSARSGGPLGYQIDATGPVGTTDCGAAGADLVTVTVPVVLNRRYRVTGYANGTPITGSAGIASTTIVDDQSGSRIIAYNPALALGAVLLGTGVHWFTATSTRTATLKVRGTASANALRVAANGASILVEDMGT